MPRLLSTLVTLLLFVVPALAQQAPSSPGQLDKALDAILDDRAFESAFWGVYVIDLEGGDVLYTRNARKRFTPASNAKLYTTAAALDLLGPDYRYRTRLWALGPVEDGVLRGPLVVQGAGDPTFGARFDPATGERMPMDSLSHTAIFTQWADSLRAAGIHSIDGAILGDDDIFDDEPLGAGWSWDDETFWYSAEMGGLSFHDNTIDFEVRATTPGGAAVIDWAPDSTTYVDVLNQSRTTPRGTRYREGYHRERGTNRIHVESLLPEGFTDPEALTITNPTRYTLHVLREALLEAGIAVSGLTADLDDLPVRPSYAGARRVAVHTSEPLSTIALMVNKPSQNLYADMLLKTLAAEHPIADDDLTPGSAEMGAEVAKETYGRAGIDTTAIQMADGSGLSRYNLVTPEMTGQLLVYMWRHADDAVRDAFVRSLPIAGVDGTIESRMKNTPAAGNVRAKTGSLSNVSSLSGYVETAGGTPLAFVLMSNHYATPTRDVRRAQDRIAEVLARYKR